MAQGQGRSSGQGVKLLMIRDYLYKRTNKDNPKNARQIAEFLASKGIKASVKTIYNDNFLLQPDSGGPVEYNAKKWGYYISKPQFEPYELRLLVDSIQSSKFITQEKAREITGKLKAFADDYTKNSLERQAYVSDRVRSMNDSVVKDADRIHEAIATNRKIGFRYFHYTPNKENPKSYSKSGALYIVSPYALSWNNGNYYLYAYDGKKFRYFRVDRMERISIPLLEEREGAKEYNAKHLTYQKAKVFDMYSGDEYTVRLRVQNRLADAVIDKFGKETIMTPADENHFTVLLPVEISPPFFAWVATFGKGMQILSPAPAVDGMRDFLEKALEMYKDEGET